MVKRVLMTADTVGGVWTYALDLARALKACEVSVALATMGAPMSEDQAAEAASLENLEVYQSEFKLEWMESPWDDVELAGDWLLELEARVKPDVVHLNSYVHAALPWHAPVLSVCHSCVLSWWEAVKGEKPPSKWNEYARRVRTGLQRADMVVAPSWTMLAEADRFYGPFELAQVIPNGRSAGIFSPGVKEPLIFAAGRAWDAAKNIATLDKAAASLPWPVHVAGEGGSFDHVEHVGRLSPSALSGWLGRASIYALPALYEPFGLSVLEAALSGCALVLGDVPSLRENWEDAALFVAPNDAKALRHTLMRLIEDPELTLRLGQTAAERARSFAISKTARRYYQAYNQLVEAQSQVGKAVLI